MTSFLGHPIHFSVGEALPDNDHLLVGCDIPASRNGLLPAEPHPRDSDELPSTWVFDPSSCENFITPPAHLTEVHDDLWCAGFVALGLREVKLWLEWQPTTERLKTLRTHMGAQFAVKRIPVETSEEQREQGTTLYTTLGKATFRRVRPGNRWLQLRESSTWSSPRTLRTLYPSSRVGHALTHQQRPAKRRAHGWP